MLTKERQRSLALSSERRRGQSAADHKLETQLLNTPGPRTVAPEKLFSDLLKRQARAVMRDITKAEPVTVPAHVARIDALIEVIRHAKSHALVPGMETLRSDAPLIFASTLEDFLCALLHTRAHHRAPSFVQSLASDELESLHSKMDIIAGLLAKPGTLEAVLSATGGDL